MNQLNSELTFAVCKSVVIINLIHVTNNNGIWLGLSVSMVCCMLNQGIVTFCHCHHESNLKLMPITAFHPDQFVQSVQRFLSTMT